MINIFYILEKNFVKMIWHLQAPRWVSTKKFFLKKAYLKKKKRLKKGFSVTRLSHWNVLTDSKARLMIRVSYMEPGFQPEICNFRLFFLTGKFFVGTRRHEAMQRAAMQRTRRMQEGSPCHRWGSGGPPPGKFCKYKLWEGHFRVILKAPGKKRLKKAFTEIGKKRFQPQKKRLKKV